MKKIYISLSFVLTFFSGYSQNNETKSADKLFKSYEYVTAAKEYLKLVDKQKADTYVYKQLADCYYNVFNSVEAEKWYAKTIETSQDGETFFRYAQMLKANKKYDEANAVMDKFAALAPNDSRAKNYLAEKNYVSSLSNQKKLFDVNSIEINSKYSDFGALLNGSTLYLSSARNESRKKYDWNGQPKLDLYKVDFSENKANGEVTSIDDLNTKFHEGPVALSADGKTIYFTRESFFEKDFVKSEDKKNKFGKMYIFKAINNNGKWENVTALPFNGKEFNTSNPSLSKDGTTLYFNSDRTGGIGGNDIWKVAVNADGTFGTPENLGSAINTEGSEQFPFIADDHTLYFSSNGNKSFGGLDVFSFDLKTNKVANLGTPVNTEKDDFGFSFNQDKNVAFFSSNREGGKGDDDIYQATPVCNVDLLATVKNAKTGEVLSQATLSFVDDKGVVVANGTTSDNGKATFNLECDKVYTVNADHYGFVSNTVTMQKSKGETPLEILLNPTEAIVTETEVILNDVYFEFNKSNITQLGAFELDKLVDVMNKYPNMVISAKSHTDSRGNDKYNLNLSERRAKSTVQYVISKGIAAERISGQGMGETSPKVVCDPCSEEQHATNRRSEFLIISK